MGTVLQRLLGQPVYRYNIKNEVEDEWVYTNDDCDCKDHSDRGCNFCREWLSDLYEKNLNDMYRFTKKDIVKNLSDLSVKDVIVFYVGSKVKRAVITHKTITREYYEKEVCLLAKKLGSNPKKEIGFIITKTKDFRKCCVCIEQGPYKKMYDNTVGYPKKQKEERKKVEEREKIEVEKQKQYLAKVEAHRQKLEKEAADAKQEKEDALTQLTQAYEKAKQARNNENPVNTTEDCPCQVVGCQNISISHNTTFIHEGNKTAYVRTCKEHSAIIRKAEDESIPLEVNFLSYVVNN